MASTEPTKLVNDLPLPTHPPEHPGIVLPIIQVQPPPAPLPPPPPPAPVPPPAQGQASGKEATISFIESIIDTLTFKRVGLVALLTLCSLFIYVLYEQRVNIIDMVIQPQKKIVEADVGSWVLSDSSKTAMQNLAKTTHASFIAITDVDLKKNRRAVRYYYLSDPSIKLSSEATRALGLPQSLFDYDAKNTAQMVAILTNEFKCDPYEDTIYFRYAPELAPQLPTICRLAVPPFVGQFVGFITVGLAKSATKTEIDSIRLEVSRIAVDIYLNDVIKKAKPGGQPVG